MFVNLVTEHLGHMFAFAATASWLPVGVGIDSMCFIAFPSVKYMAKAHQHSPLKFNEANQEEKKKGKQKQKCL